MLFFFKIKFIFIKLCLIYYGNSLYMSYIIFRLFYIVVKYCNYLMINEFVVIFCMKVDNLNINVCV